MHRLPWNGPVDACSEFLCRPECLIKVCQVIRRHKTPRTPGERTDARAARKIVCYLLDLSVIEHDAGGISGQDSDIVKITMHNLSLLADAHISLGCKVQTVDAPTGDRTRTWGLEGPSHSH